MTVQDATTRILLSPGKPLLAKNSLKKNIRVLFQIRKITGMHFKTTDNENLRQIDSTNSTKAGTFNLRKFRQFT